MLLRGVLLGGVLLAAAQAQAIIPAHAGLVHYFEGEVAIDGRAIAAINGRFAEVSIGSELRTMDGMAEVLLGPDAVLWVAPNTQVRLLRNTLEDCAIDVLTGSVIVQTGKLAAGESININRGTARVRIASNGRFRLDSTTDRIAVFLGSVETNSGDRVVTVSNGFTLTLASGELSNIDPAASDPFDRWAAARRRSIAEGNIRRAKLGSGDRQVKSRRRVERRPYPAVVMPFPR